MATLTVQTISRTGLEPSYAAAAAGGDEFANTGDEFLHIKNGDASSHTVTIETPGNVDGLAVADRAVAVGAGEERMIGPFPTSVYNDSGDLVQLTYDAVTAVTVAIVKPGT